MKFSATNVNHTCSNHCHHPQYNFFVTYHTSIHRLTIEMDRWSTISTPRYKTLCHFCSYNVVENEAHFVMECPYFKM
jgi:hypothetical protein